MTVCVGTDRFQSIETDKREIVLSFHEEVSHFNALSSLQTECIGVLLITYHHHLICSGLF